MIDRCRNQFPSSTNNCNFLRTKTIDLNYKQNQQSQFCIIQSFGIEAQIRKRERERRGVTCVVKNQI